MARNTTRIQRGTLLILENHNTPQKSAFRVKKKDHKILAQGKRNLHKPLAPKSWSDQPEPMFQAVNLHYEMSERSRAVGFGGAVSS